MKKMNITIHDDISDELAVGIIASVIRMGRLSTKRKPNDCYPYIVVSGEFTIYSDLTKKGNDTFKIFNTGVNKA